MLRREKALQPQRLLPAGHHYFCLLLFLSLLLSLVACGGKNQASSAGGEKVLSVVAGENFWGSIATQLGGKHASVKSIISSPTGDSHDYESTNNDARAVAQADYVILNGLLDTLIVSAC